MPYESVRQGEFIHVAYDNRQGHTRPVMRQLLGILCVIAFTNIPYRYHLVR